MASRTKKKKSARTTRTAQRKLTEPDLEVLIPGGSVTDERKKRGHVRTEVVHKDDAGFPVLVRQIVGTPVRRLLWAGNIGIAEATAAAQLRWLYDAAFYSGTTSKFEPLVDCSSSGDAMAKKLHNAVILRDAFDHLGNELGRVALVSIIERPLKDLSGTYHSIGLSLLPNQGKPEQTGAGKGAIVLACINLAVYFKKALPLEMPNLHNELLRDLNIPMPMKKIA